MSYFTFPHPEQKPSKGKQGENSPRLYCLPLTYTVNVFNKYLETPTMFQKTLRMSNTVFYHHISILRILDTYANMLPSIFILCFLYSGVSQLNNSCL